MHLHNMLLLLRYEPPIPKVPRKRRVPRIVPLLILLPERNKLKDPPEPRQVELIVDRRQRIEQLMLLLRLLV